MVNKNELHKTSATLVLWINLIPLLIVQDNRLNRTRLSGKQNRIVIRSLLINDVRLVFIIQLEYAGGNRYTRGCTDTQVAINGDFRDFERLLGWNVAHMDKG